MAKDLIDRSTMTAIGDALRTKKGVTSRYKPSDMPAAIASIPEGYPEPTGTVNITQNGTQNVKDYASANVNVPNSYGASDEGKVVSSGALVSQTARAAEITQNGTYDTTLNNSVAVNVSGGGGSEGVYVGTTDPASSLGENGDYYYRRSNAGKWVRTFPSSFGTSNTQIYGIEFTANANLTITALEGRCGSAKTGKLRIGNTTEVLAETDALSFPAGEWVRGELSSPVTLQQGNNYIIQVVVSGSGAGSISYAQSQTGFSVKDVASYVRARYGGFPGNSESNTVVAVNMVYEADYYTVEKQYFKQSGQWTEIE